MKKLHKMVATAGLITLLATPIKGIDPDLDLREQLSMAILKNDIHKVVSLLSDKQHLIRMRDDRGDEPIHEAAMYKHAQLIPLLKKFGADLDAKNSYGQRPIHIAAQFDAHKTIQALKDADANINAQDEDGLTAMHYAVVNGIPDTIALLAKIGADPNTTGTLGNTPLHWAIEKNHDETAQLLRRHGGTD